MRPVTYKPNLSEHGALPGPGRSPGELDIGPRLSRPGTRGFTLIEIIVILAVISILVAIITPSVLKYIDDARLSRAQEDVRNISALVNDLIKDTGQYPGDHLGTGKSFLCGPGTVGQAGWGNGTNCEDMANHLLLNAPGDAVTTDDYRSTGKMRWKGPYVQSLGEDPWGNGYQINASTLKGSDSNPTWVISAGPDSIFQTSVASTTLSGDDIGVRIK